jgi:DNA replication and repair protein RecF
VARHTISRVLLRDFRNFRELEVELGKHLTILVGPNGIGKTNVVGAIQLLTAGASFRRPSWTDLVRWGASEAAAKLEAESDLGTPRVVEMRANGSGRRSYTVGGNPVRRLADVRGSLPAVAFTPDDLRIVKDSPERRRAAIDDAGTQLSAAYAALRSEFDTVLRQRNALLKADEADEAELEVWTDKLVEVGSRLSARRQALFDRIRRHAESTYSQLARDQSLRILYTQPWSLGETAGSEDPAGLMRAALLRSRAEERARRSTVAGPHRDDMVFEVDGRDARSFASQGQQRSVALAWKIGEVRAISEIGGNDPVLLLDDVMSELDDMRRSQLGEVVRATTQTVLTTTDTEQLDGDLIAGARVVKL